MGRSWARPVAACMGFGVVRSADRQISELPDVLNCGSEAMTPTLRPDNAAAPGQLRLSLVRSAAGGLAEMS